MGQCPLRRRPIPPSQLEALLAAEDLLFEEAGFVLQAQLTDIRLSLDLSLEAELIADLDSTIAKEKEAEQLSLYYFWELVAEYPSNFGYD